MSPLTKLFVVLLVLISVVMTAGVVTFVNKIDPLQQKLTAASTRADTADALLTQRSADLATATGQLDTLRATHQTEINGLQTTTQTLRTQLEQNQGQIAQLNGQIAVLTSANASNSAALMASESTKKNMSEQVVALRRDGDERLRQVADLGQRVSRLTAENDVLERTRRNLAEQVTELQGRTDKQAAMLQDMGVPDAQVQREAGTRAGAPAINGVIRNRRTIAGKEYATISIGTQDQVSKGMQFNILDKESGQFLGVMKVDVVDANEAMGQITASGGNLAQIKAGNIVRTQIQG